MSTDVQVLVLVSDVLGELLPPDCMSLPLGVSQEVRPLMGTPREGVVILPHAWVQAGRRRAKEVLAQTGQSDMASALHYCAKKDHDSRLVIEYMDAPSGGGL